MKNLSVWLGAGALILGCASNPSMEDVAVTYSPSDNPAAEIAGLEKEVGEGRRNGLGALSPTWFERATKSLAEAQEASKKGKALPEIFKPVAQGKAELAKARETAAVAQKALPDAIASRERALGAREAALAAGAGNVEDLNKDYVNAENDFMDLTKSVERNKLADANEDKGDVIKKYDELYAQSLKKENLDTPKRIIEEAKKQGADKYAPQSLAFAEETLERTDKFISNNANAKDEVKQKSAEALFYAKRALHLTQDARILDEKEPEQRVLWVEENLSTLAKDVASQDLRDRRFTDQVVAARAALGHLHAEVGTAETEKAGLSRQTAQLQTETDALRSQVESSQGAVAMDANVAKVRKLFSTSEASVVRDGGKVVIRLKTVKFPSGKSTLAESNFALLGKVKKAVDVFGNVDVTVEGHTDSLGSAEANQRLSQQRADAVKAYLVSNEAVAEGNIEAVGKGFDEPLASNKTKEGRATNRRIDLVLTPTEAEAPTAAE